MAMRHFDCSIARHENAMLDAGRAGWGKRSDADIYGISGVRRQGNYSAMPIQNNVDVPLITIGDIVIDD